MPPSRAGGPRGQMDIQKKDWWVNYDQDITHHFFLKKISEGGFLLGAQQQTRMFPVRSAQHAGSAPTVTRGAAAWVAAVIVWRSRRPRRCRSLVCGHPTISRTKTAGPRLFNGCSHRFHLSGDDSRDRVSFEEIGGSAKTDSPLPSMVKIYG